MNDWNKIEEIFAAALELEATAPRVSERCQPIRKAFGVNNLQNLTKKP